jgi:hypothetical protein
MDLCEIVVAEGVHSGFPTNPKGELMFVMVAGPLIMNAIQFVVQDQVLKFNKRRGTTPRDVESNTLVENECKLFTLICMPTHTTHAQILLSICNRCSCGWPCIAR